MAQSAQEAAGSRIHTAGLDVVALVREYAHTLMQVFPDSAVEEGRRLQLTPASSIKVRPVRWLWLNWMAIGILALLGGREGIGKTILAYTLIEIRDVPSHGDRSSRSAGHTARPRWATALGAARGRMCCSIATRRARS